MRERAYIGMARPSRAVVAAIMFLLIAFGAVGTVRAEIVRIANPQALPVIDKASLLTGDQITSLSSRIKALAATDGVQVVVLTVPTTGDEDIFTFSQRTATEWGIGQKKENSGVLFTIASGDRKSRIPVGYGLEGLLTDALSKRILTTEVTPAFRTGNYYAGISKGVDSIIAVVKGEYKAPKKEQSGSGGDVLFWIIIFGLVVIFVNGIKRGGRGGKGGGGGGGGLATAILLSNIWSTGGHRSGGWGHSGGDSGGGFGGGFGGGGFGGGGAGDSW